MSITNLEKTLENNQLLYCNLENKIIIECISLSKMSNKKFGYFICNKIKIIIIYDIYKNIISKPTQINIFKDPIKVCEILYNNVQIILLNSVKYFNNNGNMVY